MHIAILDEELPFPMNSGKRIRTLNLLRRLARRHRLTCIGHRNADPDEARAAARHFRELGIDTIVVDRAVPPRSGPRFYARLAANLLSPLPYSVVAHQSAALRRAVREFAARHPVDVWHCEGAACAQTMRGLPAACWLAAAQNVETLIWQRLAENERSRARRWFARNQARKYREFERWAYAAATRVVAVSRRDAELMRDWFGATTVDVVDNGVDTDFFRPRNAGRDPKCLLFLGSLDWHPNLDAVRLLLDTIFPVVRDFEPEAKLLIVGRKPPHWLKERAARCGAELHGDVPDVRPFLARAGVLAVPLRVGGGSRLKILEALASGLPVVSTRVGAEGLDLEPWRHLDVVESVEPMAEALVNALRQPRRMLAQAEQGRRRVLSLYDWNALADRLEAVWLDCVTGRNSQKAA